MENRFNDKTEQEFIDKNALVHLFTAPKEKNGVSTHSIVVFFMHVNVIQFGFDHVKNCYSNLFWWHSNSSTPEHISKSTIIASAVSIYGRVSIFVIPCDMIERRVNKKKTQRKSIDKWCNIHPEKIKGVYVSVDGDSKIKHRKCLMCVFITLLCRFFVLSNEKRREFQVFAVAQRVTYSVIALFETDSYIGMQFNRNTYLFCTYIHSYIYIRLVNQYIGTV